MRRALMTPIALMAMATATHATTLASGKLYGSPNQNEVACYILNTGAKAVGLSAVTITDESGTAAPVTTNCTASLKANSGCLTRSYNISTGSAYDCSVNASSVAALRGSIEIREEMFSSTAILQMQPMR